VVVFTSSPTAADRRLVFELGAVDYIEKPTNPTEFLEAVSQAIRQWAAEPVHDR
jgi:DNA-binding response OmpR family regulator